MSFHEQLYNGQLGQFFLWWLYELLTRPFSEIRNGPVGKPHLASPF